MMRSLNHELVLIQRDSDYWYDAVPSCRLRKRKIIPEEETIPIPKRRKRSSSGGGTKLEDPEYAAFLRNLAANVEQYERPNRNLDVEDEDEVEDVDPDYKIFLANVREDGHSYIFELNNEGKSIFVKYEQEEEKQQDLHKKFEDINRNVKPTNLRPFIADVSPEMLARADESYLLFLSRAYVKGDMLIYGTGENAVYYGEDDDKMSIDDDDADDADADDDADDDDEEELTPYCNPRTPNLVAEENKDSDDDSIQFLGVFDTKSEYTEKLIKFLQVPFDMIEYKQLLEAATMHRPSIRDREVRNRSISYLTGKNSRSYFNHHPDLGQKVELAVSQNDKKRALALLRCLFFYIKNLSHEGAFVPWKNPSVLKMIEGWCSNM